MGSIALVSPRRIRGEPCCRLKARFRRQEKHWPENGMV